MNNELPSVEVIDITENNDGTCSIEFETSDLFDEMYKNETGKEVITKEDIGEYLKDIITKAFENKEGYSIKKDK